MRALVALLAGLLIASILWDGFETMVLPRRVERRLRLSGPFIRSFWLLWRGSLRGAPAPWRFRHLGFFGPLAMLILVVLWASSMIVAFAVLHWAAGSHLSVAHTHETPTFTVDLYLSGTTFTTLGLGDVTPQTSLSRFLTVVEAGTGFGFLAMVIGYLPVLYYGFSRREISIALLDARAGSPATVAELIRRLGSGRALGRVDGILAEWERWSAELVESHVSYPCLSYFRSQHDNQSWLAALTTIVDLAAVVMASADGLDPWQAKLTFAMGRHALVDLTQVLDGHPAPQQGDRLPPADAAKLIEILNAAGIAVGNPEEFLARLADLRQQYEPYVQSLARYLGLFVPGWVRHADHDDNWRTSLLERRAMGMPRSSADGDPHL